MKTVLKRLSIISLAGVMLALLVLNGGASSRLLRSANVALAQTQAANLPSIRPVIRAVVNGAPVEGTPGSACWPQTGGTPQCDFVEEPAPSSAIDLASSETIQFAVDPAVPAPAELWATLPNDKNADGEPLRTDLLKTNGELSLQDLKAGSHLVLAQAIYSGDVAGNKPFVTFAFLVNIGASVAAAGGTAPAGAGPEATSTAPVSTPEATTVTGTPEAAVTEVVGTEAATQPAATEALTTKAATVEATATSSAGGAVVIPSGPTQTPTLVPTIVPPAPTLVQPATTTPAAPVLATPGAAETSVAPDLAIIVGGRSYDPIAISACVLGQAGEQTCVNRPRNANADRILAAPGDVAQINFKGPRPSNIAVTVASADGLTTIDKQNLQQPDNLSLYTLPSNPGSYVLSVEIAWPLGKSTYYFRLVVGS